MNVNGGISSRKYGDYRVEALVGSDGYRSIYRAYDEALDRPAALKVFSTTLSGHQDFIQRFKKNMQALAQLNHPRIPLVYWFGKQEGDYVVALEWCAGGSLANLLRKRGRLPLQDAVRILLQAIQGLSAAWKLGLAHGHLRPNNLMLSEDGDIKIADFGLTPEEMDVQSFSGAFSFLSPEMGDKKPIDFRADIYSLGIIFYYILLNSVPSKDPVSEVSVVLAPLNTLTPEVLKIIDRMTKDAPEGRYGSYEELSQDLETLLLHLDAEHPVVNIPRIRDVQQRLPLKAASLFELLATIYHEKSEGMLKVNWLTLEKQFLIRQGEIVLFQSTQPNENIGNRLVANKWLGRKDFAQYRDDTEKMIRQALLAQGSTLGKIAEVYRDLMKDSLMDVFRWPAADGAFHAGIIDNAPFVSLRISDVLLEVSRNLIDLPLIRSDLSRDLLISRAPNFEQLLAPFALTAEESFLAFRFEGNDTRLETLSLLTGLPEEKILRMTYLLKKIGALELRPVQAKPAPRRPAAPPPRPQTAPPPPGVSVAPQKPPAPPPAPAPAPDRKRSFEEALVRPASGDRERPPAILSPAKAAQFSFQKAQKAFDEKNYGMAAHYCRDALQHHQEASYYHLLGMSYAQHPRFQKDAEEALHKAAALAPSDPDYHSILGAFYFQRSLWLRARTHCEKALSLKTGHRAATEILRKVLDHKPGPGECWCVRSEFMPEEV